MTDRFSTGNTGRLSIGVLGVASWDTVVSVDQYPAAGGFTFVESIVEQAGGTSANAAVAASRLGARVTLFSRVGSDDAGSRLVRALDAAGVNISHITSDPTLPTDSTIVVTSRTPQERTIFWSRGAMPAMGHRIDIDRLFGNDLVVLDVPDPTLRRFLIDLPVHTYPGARLLVPLTYVVDFPGPDEIDSVERCDAIVGSSAELCAAMQTDDLLDAIDRMQRRMRCSNLRAVAVTLGRDGALAFDASQTFRVSAIDVEVVDTTGAGDTFAGAFAVALGHRWPLDHALAFANAAAGLSTRAVGAQAAMPIFADVMEIIRNQPRAHA